MRCLLGRKPTWHQRHRHGFGRNTRSGNQWRRTLSGPQWLSDLRGCAHFVGTRQAHGHPRHFWRSPQPPPPHLESRVNRCTHDRKQLGPVCLSPANHGSTAHTGRRHRHCRTRHAGFFGGWLAGRGQPQSTGLAGNSAHRHGCDQLASLVRRRLRATARFAAPQRWSPKSVAHTTGHRDPCPTAQPKSGATKDHHQCGTRTRRTEPPGQRRPLVASVCRQGPPGHQQRHSFAGLWRVGGRQRTVCASGAPMFCPQGQSIRRRELRGPA